MEAIHARRVPMAPVLTAAEAVQHPHLRQCKTIRVVHDWVLGDLELPGFALRFSDFPHPLDLDALFLDEHNEEFFAQYLGYDVDQIKQLERIGIVRMERMVHLAATDEWPGCTRAPQTQLSTRSATTAGLLLKRPFEQPLVHGYLPIPRKPASTSR